MYKSRAECDAILLGAQSVRRDNPSLLLEHPGLVEERVRRGQPAELTKVTLTKSGNLDPKSKFFTTGSTRKLVICPPSAAAALEQRLGSAADIIALELLTPVAIVRALRDRGIRRLFVEGGSVVLTAFLSAGVFHRLRVAVAPFFVGDDSAPRFVRGARFVHNKNSRLRVTRARVLGDVTVIDLLNDDVPQL
jgi:5-amino-6-(5-phosphoribosylamino)uracil reductase